MPLAFRYGDENFPLAQTIAVTGVLIAAIVALKSVIIPGSNLLHIRVINWATIMAWLK
jgi:hypothetical protein